MGYRSKQEKDACRSNKKYFNKRTRRIINAQYKRTLERNALKRSKLIIARTELNTLKNGGEKALNQKPTRRGSEQKTTGQPQANATTSLFTSLLRRRIYIYIY